MILGTNFGDEEGSLSEMARREKEVGRQRHSHRSVRAASASSQLGMQVTANSSSLSSSAGTAGVASQNSTSTGVGANSKPFIAEGEVLRIERVTRYDMGFYMCIASNGVPPSVSQRIFLRVSCK